MYEKAVGYLPRHLKGDDALRARASIRALIEKVVVQPTPGRQTRLNLELHGDLFRMIEFAEAACSPSARSAKLENGNGPQLVAGSRMTPLVAGAGFEPATFRL